MKFFLALSALLSVASAMELAANSDIGKHLLSQSRLLAQDDAYNNQYAWVSGYSIKFQGCHAIKQWNANAEEDSDVKISTTRLVSFRLCPTESCSASKSAGCTSGYADYVVDQDTFLYSWWQAKLQSNYLKCQTQLSTCACNDDDGKADDFDADVCTYNCYVNANMNDCIEEYPYDDDAGAGKLSQNFDVSAYLACAQFDGQQNADDGNQYYIGSYCASQGGAIYLGIFSEDSCTEFRSDTTFEKLTGISLPYDSESLVTSECISCVEPQENNNGGNDADDANTVNENCETLYLAAGKCESNLPSGMTSSVNTNACTYMEGIKVVRADGILDTGKSRPSAVATAFIVIFAMAFAAMSFYVWYLRTRLGVKKASLL